MSIAEALSFHLQMWYTLLPRPDVFTLASEANGNVEPDQMSWSE